MELEMWEKDPFFSAAEEVQDSADRMESSYRTLIHALKDTSQSQSQSHIWNFDDLRRDLRAALGTAKWQLEEFERAVNASYKNYSDNKPKHRHRQFILAIRNKVSLVENTLQETSTSDAKTPTPWLRLDEGERDQFALFLSAPTVPVDKLDIRVVGDGANELANSQGKRVDNSLKNKSHASQLQLIEGRNVKTPGHRRTASANADIGSWDTSVYDDKFKRDSSNERVDPPPRRVPSYSGFISVGVESAPKLMLPKNGFRKWKAVERQDDDDIALLRPQEFSRGEDGCCEKNKNCLNTGDDCCNKQLRGWYGAVQRLLQRSQYQVQYSRPIQLTFWSALLLFFVVLVVLRVI